MVSQDTKAPVACLSSLVLHEEAQHPATSTRCPGTLVTGMSRMSMAIDVLPIHIVTNESPPALMMDPIQAGIRHFLRVGLRLILGDVFPRASSADATLVHAPRPDPPDSSKGRSASASLPFATVNNPLAILLNPDSLRLILFIIITILSFILIYFYVIKWSIIDVKDSLVSIVTGTTSWIGSGFGAAWTGAASSIGSGFAVAWTGAASCFNWTASKLTAQPTPHREHKSLAPVTVNSLASFGETWGPGVVVTQYLTKQMESILSFGDRNTIEMQQAKKARKRSQEHNKELTFDLISTRRSLDFLVEDIENNPLSASCWPDPSDDGSKWFLNYYKIYGCHWEMHHQLTTLDRAFEFARDSRSKLAEKIKELLDDVNDIRKRHVNEYKPSASDWKSMSRYISKIAQALGVGDFTCRMIEIDHSKMEAILNLMKKERDFLDASLGSNKVTIQVWTNKPLRTLSRKTAGDVERPMLERAKAWLKMTVEYYDN
ncbi:hypothetical protein ACHAPT_013051 [Fusarium lateritium]